MSLDNFSYVLLWVVQILTVLVVAGLARQVGLIHLRVKPVGAGKLEQGPSVGARVNLLPLETLRGQPIQSFDTSKLILLVLVNPTCSLCAPVLTGLPRLRKAESRKISLLVAVDNEAKDGLAYLSTYGLGDGIATRELTLPSIDTRPFGVVLSPDQVVLTSGVMNSLEQLEELLEEGEQQYRETSNELPLVDAAR